ncbi:MAG: hypothetical protein ACTTH3_00485 [Schwartzia sp. (in: firmicutes)]
MSFLKRAAACSPFDIAHRESGFPAAWKQRMDERIRHDSGHRKGRDGSGNARHG